MLIQAGRRSGKTDIPAKAYKSRIKHDFKRLGPKGMKDGFYYICAPVFGQCKRIWWLRLKSAIPKSWVEKTLEGECQIKLKFGCIIQLVGLDVPQRVEGTHCLGIMVDEWADCKPYILARNILPALADTKGWLIILGVPRKTLSYEQALEAVKNTPNNWNHFKWSSEEILDDEEIAIFKSSLDEITYKTEVEGEMADVKGRCYYAYTKDNEFDYDSFFPDGIYEPDEPLLLQFDFNVSPGVATISQEKRLENIGGIRFQETVEVGLGEVWIPVNSNTKIVVSEVINMFDEHEGEIYVYGDATGGADKTSAVTGSDWKIIHNALNAYYGAEKVNMRIKAANPFVRDRVNACNARFKNTLGEIGFILDPAINPKLKNDFEKCKWLEGSSSNLDPKPDGDTSLTHISDATGYGIEYRHPVVFEIEKTEPSGTSGIAYIKRRS